MKRSDTNMICEFRNKLAIYIDWVMTGDGSGIWVCKKETTLADILIHVILAGMITILVIWWLVPFRCFILKPLSNIKFTCKKK